MQLALNRSVQATCFLLKQQTTCKLLSGISVLYIYYLVIILFNTRWGKKGETTKKKKKTESESKKLLSLQTRFDSTQTFLEVSADLNKDYIFRK